MLIKTIDVFYIVLLLNVLVLIIIIYVGCSEEEGLDEEVQGKVEKFIAELQGRKPLSPRDPYAQWLDNGFHFFKNNIFE